MSLDLRFLALASELFRTALNDYILKVVCFAMSENEHFHEATLSLVYYFALDSLVELRYYMLRLRA